MPPPPKPPIICYDLNDISEVTYVRKLPTVRSTRKPNVTIVQKNPVTPKCVRAARTERVYETERAYENERGYGIERGYQLRSYSPIRSRQKPKVVESDIKERERILEQRKAQQEQRKTQLAMQAQLDDLKLELDRLKQEKANLQASFGMAHNAARNICKQEEEFQEPLHSSTSCSSDDLNTTILPVVPTSPQSFLEVSDTEFFEKVEDKTMIEVNEMLSKMRTMLQEQKEWLS